MSAFNIFLIVFVGIALVWGFISGLVRQVGSIAGIAAGIIGCRLFGSQAVAWLASVTGSSPESLTVIVFAYLGLFILCYFALWLLALLVRKALHGLSLGLFDRLAGALFRAFLWLFLLSLLLNAWVAVMPEAAPEGIWALRVEMLAPKVIGMATAN